MRAIACAAAAMLLTVAGSARAEGPETVQDLRCLIAIAIVAGSLDDKAKTAEVALGFMYFMGKIEGREPGYDLEGGLRQEATKATVARVKADGTRCAGILMSKGQELQAIGRSLQSLPEMMPDT